MVVRQTQFVKLTPFDMPKVSFIMQDQFLNAFTHKLSYWPNFRAKIRCFGLSFSSLRLLPSSLSTPASIQVMHEKLFV